MAKSNCILLICVAVRRAYYLAVVGSVETMSRCQILYVGCQCNEVNYLSLIQLNLLFTTI